DLRVGILTIAEKWGKWLNTPFSFLTPTYLSEKYPLTDHTGPLWLIRGNCCPDDRLCDAIAGLRPGEGLTDEDGWIAIHTDTASLAAAAEGDYAPVRYPHPVTCIRHPEDIF